MNIVLNERDKSVYKGGSWHSHGTHDCGFREWRLAELDVQNTDQYHIWRNGYLRPIWFRFSSYVGTDISYPTLKKPQRATGERNVQQARATCNRRAQRATCEPRHLTVGVLYTSCPASTHSGNSVLKFHVNQMEHLWKKKLYFMRSTYEKNLYFKY